MRKEVTEAKRDHEAALASIAILTQHLSGAERAIAVLRDEETLRQEKERDASIEKLQKRVAELEEEIVRNVAVVTAAEIAREREERTIAEYKAIIQRCKEDAAAEVAQMQVTRELEQKEGE